jgi:hypothetical protein
MLLSNGQWLIFSRVRAFLHKSILQKHVGLQVLCGQCQRFVLPEFGHCDMGSPPRLARGLILIAGDVPRTSTSTILSLLF